MQGIGSQFDSQNDVFLEESLNEVNAEFTARGKVQTVNETLHFSNRFTKDKGNNFDLFYIFNSDFSDF